MAPVVKTKSLNMLGDVPINTRNLRPPSIRRAPQKLSPELAKRQTAKIAAKLLKPRKRKRPQTTSSSDPPQNSSPDTTHSPDLSLNPSPQSTQASPIFNQPPPNSSPTPRASPTSVESVEYPSLVEYNHDNQSPQPNQLAPISVPKRSIVPQSQSSNPSTTSATLSCLREPLMSSQSIVIHFSYPIQVFTTSKPWYYPYPVVKPNSESISTGHFPTAIQSNVTNINAASSSSVSSKIYFLCLSSCPTTDSPSLPSSTPIQILE